MPDRDRSPFGARLYKARKAAGLTQEQVCERIGISQGTLSGLERTGDGSRHTATLAALYGVDAAYLATGETSPTNGGPNPGVAHQLSPQPFHHPDPLSWEDVKMYRDKPLPRTFVLAVPDDALASRTPKGTKLIFDTQATPQPGDGVLVADKNGKPYLRRYAQGRDNTWIAEADGSYLTLESERDGLELLATAVWIDRVKV